VVANQTSIYVLPKALFGYGDPLDSNELLCWDKILFSWVASAVENVAAAR
jgi:hypothetical protein